MRTALLVVTAALLCPVSAMAGKAFETDQVSGRQLIEYLDHPDWRFRNDACEEIGERKLTQAEEKVLELTSTDPSERVRRECLEALDEAGSGKLVPAAETMALKDTDVGNRKKAIAEIEDHGTPRSAPVLAKVMTDDLDADVREKAMKVLGKRGWWRTDEVRPLFHKTLLEDPDEDLRLDVCEYIEEQPEKADRDALVQALDDANPHVQRHAARALIKIGDRSVAPILREKALDATDGKVAEEFNEAASRLGG